MKKLKDIFFSEQGMSIVNVVFMVSIFWSRWGIEVLAYVVWLVYLGYSIGHTHSRFSRVVYIFYAIIAVSILVMAAMAYF